MKTGAVLALATLVLGLVVGFGAGRAGRPDQKKIKRALELVAEARDDRTLKAMVDNKIAEWMNKATSGKDTAEAKETGKIVLSYDELHGLHCRFFDVELRSKRQMFKIERVLSGKPEVSDETEE